MTAISPPRPAQIDNNVDLPRLKLLIDSAAETCLVQKAQSGAMTTSSPAPKHFHHLRLLRTSGEAGKPRARDVLTLENLPPGLIVRNASWVGGTTFDHPQLAAQPDRALVLSNTLSTSVDTVGIPTGFIAKALALPPYRRFSGGQRLHTSLQVAIGRDAACFEVDDAGAFAGDENVTVLGLPGRLR